MPEEADLSISSGDLADTKVCPFCAETIKKAAIKCRYCGSDLSPVTTANSASVPELAPPVVPATPSLAHSEFPEPVTPPPPLSERTRESFASPLSSLSSPMVGASVGVRTEGEEKVYHEDQTIKVTSTRTIIAGKTYALANMTSVVMHVEPPNRGGAGCAIFIGGLVLLFAFIFTSFWTGAVSVIFLTFGAMFWSNAKTRYWVRIASSSAESNAVWAYNRAYIENVVAAINKAIVGRG